MESVVNDKDKLFPVSAKNIFWCPYQVCFIKQCNIRHFHFTSNNNSLLSVPPCLLSQDICWQTAGYRYESHCGLIQAIPHKVVRRSFVRYCLIVILFHSTIFTHFWHFGNHKSQNNKHKWKYSLQARPCEYHLLHFVKCFLRYPGPIAPPRSPPAMARKGKHCCAAWGHFPRTDAYGSRPHNSNGKAAYYTACKPKHGNIRQGKQQDSISGKACLSLS